MRRVCVSRVGRESKVLLALEGPRLVARGLRRRMPARAPGMRGRRPHAQWRWCSIPLQGLGAAGYQPPPVPGWKREVPAHLKKAQLAREGPRLVARGVRRRMPSRAPPISQFPAAAATTPDLRHGMMDIRRCLEAAVGDCQNVRSRVVQRPSSTFSACHQRKRVAEDFDHGPIGDMHPCRFQYEICPWCKTGLATVAAIAAGSRR